MEGLAGAVRIVAQGAVRQLLQVVLVGLREFLQVVAAGTGLFQHVILECPGGFLHRMASLTSGGWWMNAERLPGLAGSEGKLFGASVILKFKGVRAVWSVDEECQNAWRLFLYRDGRSVKKDLPGRGYFSNAFYFSVRQRRSISRAKNAVRGWLLRPHKRSNQSRYEQSVAVGEDPSVTIPHKAYVLTPRSE